MCIDLSLFAYEQTRLPSEANATPCPLPAHIHEQVCRCTVPLQGWPSFFFFFFSKHTRIMSDGRKHPSSLEWFNREGMQNMSTSPTHPSLCVRLPRSHLPDIVVHRDTRRHGLVAKCRTPVSDIPWTGRRAGSGARGQRSGQRGRSLSVGARENKNRRAYLYPL